MATSKIAITMEEKIVKQLDKLVKEQVYPSRSRAIQEAVEEKLQKLERGRLARECAKLDPAYEKALAEEGLTTELGEWPDY
ncbi:MAG: ribbon-helix-helix protein, CopG family [Deltaproteobacteria bacterium]|nr:ribbon-helix-helix protein, CopG family [Deltaproteobacteria bacterium]MBW1872650.1 ribbon-helix-helix protein, CopG family [Deltaproteobacteria bacterium]